MPARKWSGSGDQITGNDWNTMVDWLQKETASHDHDGTTNHGVKIKPVNLSSLLADAANFDWTLKKATPAVRLIGTETSWKDVRISEDAGLIKFQHNTGTESVPVWTNRLTVDMADGALVGVKLGGQMDANNQTITNCLIIQGRNVNGPSLAFQGRRNVAVGVDTSFETRNAADSAYVTALEIYGLYNAGKGKIACYQPFLLTGGIDPDNTVVSGYPGIMTDVGNNLFLKAGTGGVFKLANITFSAVIFEVDNSGIIKPYSHITPNADNTVTVGATDKRLAGVNIDTVNGIRIWNNPTPTDTYPLTKLTDKLWFGPGGTGSDIDTNLYRGAANLLKTDDALNIQGRQYLGSPNSAPTDSDLFNGSISLYLDEAGNNLKVRVKYSDGTTLKTGSIALT